MHAVIKKKRRPSHRGPATAGLILLLGILGSGCATPRPTWRTTTQGRLYLLEVSGYCPCQKCCGWERNWRGQPVLASGPLKGQAKLVGITASGTRAGPGTLAADTNLFPFGTLMYIPGYGYGRVEDRGKEIRGYKLDLFFPRHHQAQQWGRTRRAVRVWLPHEWQRIP